MLPRQAQNVQRIPVHSNGNPYENSGQSNNQRNSSLNMNNNNNINNNQIMQQQQLGQHSQHIEDQPKLMRLNTISTPQPYQQQFGNNEHQQHNFQPQQQPHHPQLYHQSKSVNNPTPSVTTPGSKNLLKPKNSFGFNSGAQQQQQQQQLINNNSNVRQSLLVRGNSGGGGMQIQSQNFQKLTDNLKNISNFINNGVGSSGRQDLPRSSTNVAGNNKMNQFRKNSSSFEKDSRSGDEFQMMHKNANF